jgi:hypothetical protein
MRINALLLVNTHIRGCSTFPRLIGIHNDPPTSFEGRATGLFTCSPSPNGAIIMIVYYDLYNVRLELDC